MSTSAGTCKFYVSIQRPECGDIAEDSVLVRLADGSKASVDLCKKHLKGHATAQAESARRRIEAKTSTTGETTVTYLVKGGVTKL